MKSKWVKTQVNVCDRTIRNRLNEIGLTYKKAKGKPVLIRKQKKMRVWFYGISSIVGYLMPNPVHTYILDIYDLVWFGFMAYQLL